MAVNFAAAPSLSAVAQHPHDPRTFRYPSQSSSSDSSDTATSASISPSSPQIAYNDRAPHPSRQLRAPKKPLYVPAVLRPTERPARSSPPKRDGIAPVDEPLTPPSSSGTNSQQLSPTDEDEDTVLRKFLGEGVVSGGVTRIVTDEWNENTMEDVTGSPTKDHWKPDDAAAVCAMSYCNLNFNLIRRRHHCRRCGNIFCADHTRALVPLDQHARFHPRGFLERACDVCAKDFRFWEKAMRMKRRYSAGEPASPASKRFPDALDVPVADGSSSPTAVHSRGGQSSSEPIAGSFVGSLGNLGNLGNWSTF